MRRPDVDRMMASMSAREYKEWEAYERATGPLDSMYEREMLSQLHELIQFNNLLTGASVTKKGGKNPAGKFRRVTRAYELWDPESFEEEDEEEDDDDPYAEEEEDREPVFEPGEYDPSKDPFA
jgi:hypothetical protein